MSDCIICALDVVREGDRSLKNIFRKKLRDEDQLMHWTFIMFSRRICYNVIHSEAFQRGQHVGFWNVCKVRSFMTSDKCLRTRGDTRIKSVRSNLQKLKHLKYSDAFVRKEAERFKLSKRRLANMMGEDPNTFDDDDVKKAIRYLFPSDLDEDSKPSMKHPSKVYTSREKIHWDETGRPFHYLFYTQRQHSYQLLHELYQCTLDARNTDITNADEKAIDLTGTRWMTSDEISESVLDDEVLHPIVYKQIIAQLERLLEEENAWIAGDKIMSLRVKLPIVSMLDDIKELETMEDGRKFVEDEGIKKTAIANVRLIQPGTGKITINGAEFHKHFLFLEDRQTVLAPFCFLDQLTNFDVEVSVNGGVHIPASFGGRKTGDILREKSLSSQAIAIRLAISRCLRSFISEDDVEMMRRAGLLTFDKRWKERKLFGQHKARKKHTWKRR